MRLITAPNFENVKDTDKVIFLAGPIQGSFDWHKSAIHIVETEMKKWSQLPNTPNIVIASPKRLTGKETTNDGYKNQVLWEKQFLERAGSNGVVLFWFCNQKEITLNDDGKQRSYGKTSRTEWGEWKCRHDFQGVDVVLGLDTEWQKEKYFKTRIELDESNIPILFDLKSTVLEAIKKCYK